MPVSKAADPDIVDAVRFLEVLAAVTGGDFGARVPLHWMGAAGKVAEALNDTIAANQALEAELAISRRLVSLMGGECGVSSVAGAGLGSRLVLEAPSPTPTTTRCPASSPAR